MQTGTFSPPSFELYKNYDELAQSITHALDTLKGFSADDINKFSDGSLTFKLGSKEMPFTNQDFLFSFSLPIFTIFQTH